MLFFLQKSMSGLPYTTDTSITAELIQFQLVRRMTPEQRVEKAVARMCKAAILRRHPEFGENEVSLKFIELNYGKQLSDEVRACRLAKENCATSN